MKRCEKWYRIRIFFVLVLAIIFLFSCKTAPVYEEKSLEENEFVLDNGIKVFVKNAPNAKVNTLELYFDTGASSLNNSNLGYLKFLLELLTIENENYSRKQLENILQEKMADISSGTLSDYSFLRMTSLSKYFDEIYDIFSMCVTNPSFESFEILKSQAQFNFLNTKYIDYNLLMKKSSEVLREQTDYFGKNSFTSETILSLNLDSIKALYESLFVNDNLFLIAYGSFNADKLFTQLNSTLGKIVLVKNSARDDKAISIDSGNDTNSAHDKVSAHDSPLTQDNGQAKKFFFKNEIIEIRENEENAVEFACSYKKLPELTKENEKKFAACYIANLMYSDILYNVIREKNGACYSVFSNMHLSRQPVLICTGYRITDRQKFFSGIEESKKIFAQGKILLNENETVDATEKLESYKNILINRLYGEIFTSKQYCSMMAISLSLGDDINFMYDFAQTIENVTDEDLKSAIAYICSQNEQWFYLSNKDDVRKS